MRPVVSTGQPPKNPSDDEGFSRVRLAEVGIDYKLSSRAQKLAGPSDETFEEKVLDARDAVNRAVRTVIRSVEKAPRKKK